MKLFREEHEQETCGRQQMNAERVATYYRLRTDRWVRSKRNTMTRGELLIE